MPSDGAGGDWFGCSVGISGDTVVGAYDDDSWQGSAYVYRLVPDLAISKTVMPDTNVTYRGEVTYSVVLSNSGAADTNGTLFTDTLPGEVDFDRWVEQPSGASESADEITWRG